MKIKEIIKKCKKCNINMLFAILNGIMLWRCPKCNKVESKKIGDIK